MSPCHTAQHLCIFLSLAGNLQCPSAVTLSLCVYICSPSFPLSISTHVSLITSIFLSFKSFTTYHWSILFFHIVSGSTVLHVTVTTWLVLFCFFCFFSISLPPLPFSCQSSFRLSWTQLKVGSFFITLHSLSLSLTVSLLCPPSLSFSVSQWTFSVVFIAQRLKLNWRRVIKAKMESDLLYPSHPSFLLSVPSPSSLPHSCVTETVSSFRCLFALQLERAPWFACCHSITKPNSECVLSAQQNVL